jgi:hypothetical protein
MHLKREHFAHMQPILVVTEIKLLGFANNLSQYVTISLAKGLGLIT